jgi:Predicted membrane protein (DUF2232)
MDARISRIGDSVMLSAAIVLGTALAPILAFVGLPVAAAGIAGLAYRGRVTLAAFAAAAGVVVVGVLDVSSVVFVAPVLAAVVLTVVLLPKRPIQSVATALVAVLAIANMAADALFARSKGTTLPATIAQESQALVADMSKAMGASAPADTLRAFKDAARLIASAWPSAYFQGAVFVGVLVVVAVVWAARRVDRPLGVPPLSRLDLTPHVLWVFVAGLFLLAASYASFAGASTLGVVGLNLVLCARTLFFLQGISVAAGMLDRTSVGLGGRILAMAVLAALDALTLVVSFTGLLDFWVNFRRLPRDGAMQTTVAEPDGRRW